MSARSPARAALVQLGAVEVLVVDLPPLRPLPSVLTPSERDVVMQVTEGASNREIARARGTSERTVANQLKGIYRKLGVFSRTELVAVVTGALREDGPVDPSET